VIASIKGKETAKIFAGESSKKLPFDIQEGAREKMLIIATISRIEDLWAIPSLRAEKLSGDRVGQWSVRINKQW
jgi:proteic killer suppression protein